MDETASEVVASKADYVAQRDQLAALFEAHPHTVIHHEVLEGLVGRNYQQRISDARRDLRMPIENVKRYGSDGKRITGDYRFRPASIGRDAALTMAAEVDPLTTLLAEIDTWLSVIVETREGNVVAEAARLLKRARNLLALGERQETAEPPQMCRVWAMPNHETFSIKPIGDLVRRYAAMAKCSVDPFARNSTLASITNDLNPKTSAQHHLVDTEFLALLSLQGVRADLVLIDPPYSPRQVKECYDSVGHQMQQDDALLGKIRKIRKAAIDKILDVDGHVITCGWNTVGMGKTLGYELVEVLLVCHGSDHNDTIVTVERKR